MVLYKGLDIRAAGAIAPLGLPAIVYAFVIWSYGMTREPLEAGLMFFLTGLAALLSPLLAVQRVGRILGIVAVIILVVAGIMPSTLLERRIRPCCKMGTVGAVVRECDSRWVKILIFLSFIFI